MEVHLLDRRARSSCAGSCSGRCVCRTAPRCRTRRSERSPARSGFLCSQCHIEVQSSLRSRGIFLSRDHMESLLHSHTAWHTHDRRYPDHTLCDSELRGILEDRRSGRTPGGRRLRSYSRTAAGTAGREDQEDRHVHTHVHSSLSHTDTSPSLCHTCRYFDSYTSADSWHQTCPQDILHRSESRSSPDCTYSCQSQSRTLHHDCSYSVQHSPPQTSLEGSRVHSPFLFDQGCIYSDR